MNKLYARDRVTFRKWLEKNHDKEKEVWLVFYRKVLEKPNISYNEAVEEALCFGWIDSIVRPNDEESRIQRFTPRNPKSNWSQLNRERVRILKQKGLMTPAGEKLLPPDIDDIELRIAPDIEKALKKDPEVWSNFNAFPDIYKRIRIFYVEDARIRPEEFEKRLANLIKNTKKNKMFGTILP